MIYGIVFPAGFSATDRSDSIEFTPMQDIFPCLHIEPCHRDKVKCRIPDDCIDFKRYPLFIARAVLQELIESLQSTQGAKPC